MRSVPAMEELATHRVTNQPGEREGARLWSGDPALREAIARAGGDAACLAGHARALDTPGRREAAREANRVLPQLHAWDAGGRRLDEVRYHPAYHDFLTLGLGAGYAALAWEGGPGGHATHAAFVYLHSQVEPGTCCPMTMTYAGVAALGDLPDWRAKLLSRRYDPSIRPLAQKAGATLGMAMTEKQGGSDLRGNTTRAELTADGWRVRGHKWFVSAPMADGFLTLAQSPEGLSCFLVPRWLEGGRNGIRLQRLKDKLGNRSNASAEVEFEGALALPVGEPGQGVRTILAMVTHTRLDTALAPAGLMRAALAEAYHWCEGRMVFQRRLIDQPLMRAVLADLALDWEAGLALGLRVASAFDAATPWDRALARVGVALAKFLNTKRCAVVVGEAMEVLGGTGYVEEGPVALLFRESPLNSIWEGSGNVICLDVLRTLARDPLAAEVLAEELRAAAGADRRFDAALREHRERWPTLPPEAEARWFVERLAVLLAAAQLLRFAPPAVADAYVLTRVVGQRGHVPGAVSGIDTGAILARLGGAQG